MDELDAAILRELLRGRVLLWGGIDPRVGTSEIAARLGVDRTTVWSRLRTWKRTGFLVRQEVVPNPRLFDAGLAVGDIRVDDTREKARVLDALGLVDGVLAGLDEVGPYVLLVYANASEGALQRCTRLVERLPGVDAVSLCVPFDPPRATLALTPADWRLVRALRQGPDRPMREVADEAGVSLRTATRRYGEMLRSRAVWSFPIFDFGCYRAATFARFAVTLDAAASAPLLNACQHELRQMVWWDAPLAGLVSEGMAWVDVYAHLSSVPEAEDVQRWLLARPGVSEVEIHFPRSWFVVPAWFDERIAQRCAA